MPQLPDRSVFGNAPSGLSGRVSVDYSGAVSPGRQIVETAAHSEDGMRVFGAGLERAGNAVAAYAQQEDHARNHLNMAMAKATGTILEDNVKQAIANETDPEKIKELLGGIDAGYQSAGANLSGEQAQLFGLDSMHRANNLRLLGEKRIGELNEQNYTIAAQGTIKDLLGAYVNGDSQTRHDALDSAGKIYDYMAASNYLTPEQAFHAKEQFAKGAVESFIINQPADKQLELLGVTPQNVNEAAGKGAAFFQSKGWQPHQAAAIMGHLLHESGGKLNPNAVNPHDGADGSDSIGIGQWNSKRAQQLKAFAAANGKPWNDLGIQLAFVQHELETSEGGAASVLRKTGDIDSAAAAFLHYERPKNWQGGLDTAAGGRQRLAYGRRIFNSIGKEGAFGTPSTEGSYDIASSDVTSVLSPADHYKMVGHALQKWNNENLVKKQDMSELKAQAQSDVAKVMETGTPIAGVRERLQSTFGPEMAQGHEDQLVRASNFFAASQNMQMASDKEMDAIVNQLKPSDSDPNWEKQQWFYMEAQKKAQEIRDARVKDPASAVDKSPAVTAAMQKFDQKHPETFQNVVAARLRAQADLGIPEIGRSAITQEEAKQYAALLRPFTKGQADILDQDAYADKVAKIVHDKYGPYSQQAWRDILLHVTLKSNLAETLSDAISSAARSDTAVNVNTPQAAEAAQRDKNQSRALQISGVRPAPQPVSAWRPYIRKSDGAHMLFNTQTGESVPADRVGNQ